MAILTDERRMTDISYEDIHITVNNKLAQELSQGYVEDCIADTEEINSQDDLHAEHDNGTLVKEVKKITAALLSLNQTTSAPTSDADKMDNRSMHHRDIGEISQEVKSLNDIAGETLRSGRQRDKVFSRN